MPLTSAFSKTAQNMGKNYLGNHFCKSTRILSAEDHHTRGNLSPHCSYGRHLALSACYKGSGFGIHQYQPHNVHLLSTDHSCIGMNQEH